MVKKKKILVATLEELQAELAEAQARLSEVSINGPVENILAATAEVHVCEQKINDAYYRRWSLP